MSVALSINIDVDDLDRGIAFYADALGLTLRRRLFDGHVAELAGARVPVFLLEKKGGTVPCAGCRRDYTRHWTPVHLDFIVPELDRAVARAVKAGAVPEGDIGVFEWGRLAAFSDPFGNDFCLIEFTAAGYDTAVSDPDS